MRTIDRQAHAGGAIAELKRHGASRARCRATGLMQLQLLAAATVINVKRLTPPGTAPSATKRVTLPRAPPRSPR